MDANRKKKLLIGLPIAALLVIICVMIFLLNSCSECAPADNNSNNETVIFAGDDSRIPGLTYTITKSVGMDSNNSTENKDSRYSLNFNTSPSSKFLLKGTNYSLEENTDENGSFSVFDLPAGEYTLTVNGKTITIIISDDINKEETNSKADSSDSQSNNNSSITDMNSSVTIQESSKEEESSEASTENAGQIEDSEVSSEYIDEPADDDSSDYSEEAEESKANKPSTGTTTDKNTNSDSGTGSTSKPQQHVHNFSTPVYDEVLIKEGYSEQVLVKDAWDEEVLVEEAYDEYVYTGKIIVVCYCEATFYSYEDWLVHTNPYSDNIQTDADIEEFMKHQGYQTMRETELIHHEAEYKTIHHEAEYKTVTHDPVYETQVVGYACSCGAVK